MRRVTAMVLGAILVMTITGVAFAHAFLETASPGAGARVEEPPAKLVLSFTEPIEGADVGVQVFNAAGALLASDKDPQTVIDWATITLALPKLAPGSYHVVWDVELGGGHRTKGDYHFTIVAPGSQDTPWN